MRNYKILYGTLIILLLCVILIKNTILVRRVEEQNVILDTMGQHFYKFAKDIDLVEAIKKRNEFLVKRSIPLRALAVKLRDEQKRLESADGN